MFLSLVAFLASYSMALQQGGGIPWFVWVLIVIVLIALGLWLMRRPSQEAPPPAAMPAPQKPTSMPSPEPPAAMIEAPPAAPPAPMNEEVPVVTTAPEMPSVPVTAEAPKEPEMPSPPAMAAEAPEAPSMTATLTRQPAVRDVPPPTHTPATTVTQPPGPAVQAQSDDLTRIEGIGPATANALQAGGITTYQQLADADSASVTDILRKAGLRVTDPGTWAQQAKLAATGDWAKLKRLQDKLTGGRKA